MKNHWIPLFSAIFLVTVFNGCSEESDSPSPPPPAFSSADNAGDWWTHGIASGGASGWSGWFRSQSQANMDGNVNFLSYLNSSGSTTAPAGLVETIDSTGRIAVVGQPSFHGQMSLGKNVRVATMDDGGGGHSLCVGIRMGGTFSQSDLAGTWSVHSLVVRGTDWAGWYRGLVQLDTSGNGSFLSFLTSDGMTSGPTAISLIMSADGTFVISGEPTCHGTMSNDRNFGVFTKTDGGTDFDMSVMVRVGGSFSTGDLGGSWSFHSLVTGETTDWSGWYHGTHLVHADGTFELVEFLNSDGGTSGPASGTLLLVSDGTCGLVGNSSFHGTMSLDQSMIIMNKDDGGGGYDLTFLFKLP